MKKFKSILLVVLLIPCIFLFNACAFVEATTNFVTKIEQTEVVNGKTTYTVHYSNGTTSIFVMENGKDGDNGRNLDLASIKAHCLENDIDYESFLEQFLSIDVSQSVQEATNRALLSAVSIYAEHTSINNYGTKDISFTCGAGVIYEMNDEFSYVVTNFHVLYHSNSNQPNHMAKKICLFQYGARERVYKTDEMGLDGYPVAHYGEGSVMAEYVGGSMTYDLAILKVETVSLLANNPHATPVEIAKDYEVGETAIAVGNPEGYGLSATDGIISVEVDETLELEAADESTIISPRVIRIDTAVNPGNSGGGLFDISGNLIGIVNAKITSYDVDNMAYALPCDHVVSVVDNLIYYHEQTNEISKPKKLMFNISISPMNRLSTYNPATNRFSISEDVTVVTISAGLGNSIGLKIDDVIKTVTINDSEHVIDRDFKLLDLMLTVRAGDKILLKLDRAGETVYAGVTDETGVLISSFVTVD